MTKPKKLPTGRKHKKRERTNGNGHRRDGLNEREASFISHFLADPAHNRKEAAIKAGYAAASASKGAYNLLQRKHVIAEIRRRTVPPLRRLEINADKVLQGLAELAFANMLDFVDVDPLTGDPTINLAKVDRVSAGAITELTTETYTEGQGKEARTVTRTKLKLANRHPSLVTLAQHLKLIGEDQTDGNVRTVRFIIEGAPPGLVEQFQRHSEPLNITPARETQP